MGTGVRPRTPHMSTLPREERESTAEASLPLFKHKLLTLNRGGRVWGGG